MTRRAFEEEAGLYDPKAALEEFRSADEPALKGLPPADVILFETGQAIAVSLTAGVLLCALLQWTGIR